MPAGRPKGLGKTGGRTPGSPNKATLEIKELIRKKDMNKVVDALFDSAVGLYAEADIDTGVEGKTKKNEKIRVYQKAPSERAASVLIEHGYGKAPQKIEGGTDPIKFEIKISDVADED